MNVKRLVLGLSLSLGLSLGLGFGLSIGVWPVESFAQTPSSDSATTEHAPSHYQQIDQLVTRAMDQQALVGVALGIVENGQISYLKGYGWADQESREAVSLNSSFRWASLSKPVTAILSLQLVEQGLLDLDQDIRAYWRAYQNGQAWRVTQRQLLAHLAGVGNYDDVEGWQAGLRKYQQAYSLPENRGADMLHAAEIFASAPLLSRPGMEYRYSTFGYILAGAVLSKAGEDAYLAQFNARIGQKLGLTTMQPDRLRQYIPYRVSGYYRDAQGIKKRAPDDVAWKLAGGGFTSNLHDATRFMQALINHELVSPKSSQILWTEQKTLDDQRTHYGLGFGISERFHQPCIEHGGSQTQTRTLMSFLPQQKLGFVLMSNSEWADFGPLKEQIYAALMASAILKK
jgi:serine beta-lactamase-like protein LACTB, mitochondrial